jgi:NADH-quinone oxidoreductase subunit J
VDNLDSLGVNLAFYILAAMTLAAAGGVMLSRNLFHAVLFLILSFVGLAGFFVLLSAEVLATAQVVIYVGAISVLVLFAVLLTPRASRDNGETKMVIPAVLLAVSLGAIFMFVIYNADWQLAETPRQLSVQDLGSALLDTWVLPFELASVLLTAALIGAVMLSRSTEDEAEDPKI